MNPYNYHYPGAGELAEVVGQLLKFVILKSADVTVNLVRGIQTIDLFIDGSHRNVDTLKRMNNAITFVRHLAHQHSFRIGITSIDGVYQMSIWK